MSESPSKRILLVEDDAISALAERHALESAGYHVTVAATGETAVAVATEEPRPDLILMDIELGKGIDGTETAERILRSFSVPIVFLSTHTDPEIVARTERIASYGYVLKNSGTTVLLASVRMAFQLRDARRELERANREATEAATLQTNLFEQVPGAIYQFQYFPDGTSRFPMASRNIFLVYEVTPEAVATDATPVYERIHPDDFEEVVASIIQSRDTLEVWQHDYRVILPTRGERWLRGRARPERLPDGSVLWHGFIADITAEEDQQERLRRSEENFRTFFDTSPDFLWVLDTEGSIIDVNRTALSRLGYTKDQLIGRSVLEVHPAHRREEAARIVGEMGAGGTDTCPIPLVTREGREIPVETTIAPTMWDGREALVGVSRDISALALSEEKYARMSDSSPAMIGLRDSETGEFIEVNDTACRLLGFERDEIIGVRAVDRIRLDPNLRAGLRERIRRDGTFENVEAQVFAKDGSALDVLLFGTRVDLQDRKLDLITAIDIRKRKRAEEELRRALAANQTLMAELNHRVKNNLAMVTSLIRLKNADIGDVADLSDLESRVEAITSLHEQLQQSAQLDRVALRPYVERVLRSAFRGAPVRVTIEMDISDEEVPTRLATTIGLILNELATNAAKYALPEAENPRFSVTQSEGDGTGRTRLVVANSGPPIAADISLDNPTGLGLRLVSALVSQIDGQVRFERDPETTFTIEYPRPG
jgi:PAS domain S-box-containing protein